MAQKRTKADTLQRNVERLEGRDEARREIVDINEKRRELLEEQIRQRAHELYEARGRKGGHGVEDWLQAEAEVRAARRRAAAGSGKVIPFPLFST